MTTVEKAEWFLRHKLLYVPHAAKWRPGAVFFSEFFSFSTRNGIKSQLEESNEVDSIE